MLTEDTPVATVTRSLRVEVMFVGLRGADRSSLYKRIWGAMADVMIAANKLMTTLWLLHSGGLTLPVEAPRRGPNKGGTPKPWPRNSACYRFLNGEWQPFAGEPAYVTRPGSGKLSGASLGETGAWVLSRFDTDAFDVQNGKQTLPTFKRSPLGAPAQGSKVRADGVIGLHLFAKDDPTGGGWVHVRPVGRLDGHRKTTLKRIAEEQYKLGACKLIWYKPENRKGKWYVSIAYTAPVEEMSRFPATATDGTDAVVCGIDIGIRNTSMLAFVDAATGVPQKCYEVVQLPEMVRSAWGAVTRERRERSVFNRDEYALREGRGRGRKLRVTRHLGERLSRMVDTAHEQHVAAVIRLAKARGATILAIEDHAHWSVGKAHDRAEGEPNAGTTNARRAKSRTDYFRWHQGLLHEKYKHVAAREGMQVVEVNPAMTSRTCPDCGKLWDKTGIYTPKGVSRRPEPPEVRAKVSTARVTAWGDLSRYEFGRVTLDRFVCTCGCDKPADYIAAVNIARRWNAPRDAKKKTKLNKAERIEKAIAARARKEAAAAADIAATAK